MDMGAVLAADSGIPIFYRDVVAVVQFVLTIVAVAVEGWAFVHCAMQRAEAFGAAGKLSKGAWLGITGVAIPITLFLGPQGILGLIAVTAAIVYHVDVRPALKEITDGPW